MILSKGQLKLAAAAAGSDVVNLHSDGSASVVSAGAGIVAVGPVPADVRSEAVVDDSGSVNASVAAKGLASVRVGTDKMFGGRLEMVDARDDGDVVSVRVRDETRREDVTRLVKSRRGTARATRAALRRALRVERSSRVRVVVNRRWLIGALKAIDAACPDAEARAPVWLSAGDNGELVLRSVNMRTDQRALAVGQAYDVARDEWLDDSTWERRLRGGGGRKRRKQCV